MAENTDSKKEDQTPPRWTIMGQRFYAQATVDLESARENIRPRRANNAVRLAHEAAEKALKGVHWHLLAEEPPWTHNLPDLAAILAARAGDVVGNVPEELAVAMGALMSRLERSRYPSGNIDMPIPADLVDVSDATDAVENAQKVMNWSGDLLQRPSGRPKPKKN